MCSDYATTTDLLTQNLTMVVGNTSQRCFANASWRAFTRLCAFLQEHNLQPWGTIRDAVQESLETSEAVDLHSLPGLQSLRELTLVGHPISLSPTGMPRSNQAVSSRITSKCPRTSISLITARTRCTSRTSSMPGAMKALGQFFMD